ncbi:type II toxin-antitoxin system VapC family toxin [Falsirhodobacter xinxiangensis]|uniref:type II toxin-antitoxin system VapC family toxin n=1 Tax=Falsirhodobacter xinxiangensis TaxID=2530049 RepID=UPI0010AAB04F|nr:type II toxin-antitoxin system VapC family toxin [Rhodobacter xinxiangensis]
MIVLDTNVLSEVQKPKPDPNVMAWLDAQEPSNLFVTAITAEELLFGAFILPVGDRRARLVGTVESMLADDFAFRVLPYDMTAAQFYASRVSSARARGITIGHADGQIGAIVAAQKAASIATRDTAPFDAMGVKVINPWEYQS